jgi:hypothetical protein
MALFKSKNSNGKSGCVCSLTKAHLLEEEHLVL